MTLCQRIGPLLAGAAASAVLAGGVVAIPLPPGGPAVYCRRPGLPLAPAGDGYFTAITVTSGCSAWAVGGSGLGTFQLIELERHQVGNPAQPDAEGSSQWRERALAG
jgi:hypothetical protein